MGWEFFAAIIRLVIFLPLVLGLAYIIIRFGLLKFNYSSGSSKAMKVVDRLPVAPKSSLLVVRVADKYFLLAHNEGKTRFLQQLDSYPEDESGNNTAGFDENGLISRIRNRVTSKRFGTGED